MVFAIHWHESAMDLHVFSIPIPPPICVFICTWSSPPRQNGLLKLREKHVVLDQVVFWFGRADWQVKTRRSTFLLWDLADKALLTLIRKEVEWQSKCFIEWKYQKYKGYRELCRQNEKEKLKKVWEGKWVEGSESKAHVLECMIKNLKKAPH